MIFKENETLNTQSCIDSNITQTKKLKNNPFFPNKILWEKLTAYLVYNVYISI